MKQGLFYGVLCILLFSWGCREDDSYKGDTPHPDESGKLEFVLTGRVGAVVDGSLTDYVDAVNLFLFREGETGDFLLYRTLVLDKSQLRELAESEDDSQAGFTVSRVITFDSVPIARYRVVGLGNALDSVGNPRPHIALRGITLGNTMSQVLAAVLEGEQAPRLFWGMTDIVEVGTDLSVPPVLQLFRKVAMFSLTLEKIPDVVNRIDMQIENTYGSFDMAGNYTPNSDITVFAFNEYTQNARDSITLNYVTLPTVEGDSTTFDLTFYLLDGGKPRVELPCYVLKPNTITKVTATIDTDEPGGIWKVNFETLISVNVEWNVDQEPPITI